MQKRQSPTLIGTDLTGKQFGLWTVLGPAPLPANRKWTKGRFWNCQCSCGAAGVKATGHLTRKHLVGCRRCTYLARAGRPGTDSDLYGDLTGKQFGDRVVLGLASKKEGRAGVYWACRCVCGTESEVEAANLRSGDSMRCRNCVQLREAHKGYRGHRELSGTFWSHIRRQAEGRSLPFQITIQEAWELFEQQGRRCALTGVPLAMAASSADLMAGRRTASLDRIDSQLGYVSGNVQWVHALLNVMKGELPQSEFVQICADVVKHLRPLGPGPAAILLANTASVRSGRRHSKGL